MGRLYAISFVFIRVRIVAIAQFFFAAPASELLIIVACYAYEEAEGHFFFAGLQK